MPRIHPVDPENATGRTRELLDSIASRLGRVPNLLRTFAHSPAVLESYLSFKRALDSGVLPPALREQIALTVAEQNRCDYCVAAHVTLGSRAGLSPEQIAEARRGQAADPKAQAVLRFARKLVETRGHAGDDDIAALRTAGCTDAEIAETVAHVAFNLFTNYFNHVAQTEIDFPPPPPG